MKPTSILLGSVAVGALSYVLIFDYRRRNSPAFRKQLRKTERKHRKAKEVGEQKQAEEERGEIKLSIVRSMTTDPMSVSTPQEFEAVFMKELSQVEAYIQQGDKAIKDLVVSMYRVLAMHPMPDQIIAVLADSVPKRAMALLNAAIEEMPFAAFKGAGPAAPAAPAAAASPEAPTVE
ncbi:uncharacterized protein V1518DRAFT_415569 [Limtongia smithiae]|uniref:uncharacterized protein n=1 Tax=Limtongia smithiae TaxID=1125753 RepID=UPI0034CFA93C